MAEHPILTWRDLEVGGRTYRVPSLRALAEAGHDLARLPYVVKILLENLLRRHGRGEATREEVEALLAWGPEAGAGGEITFMPGRVLLQDFTGVPALVDLAAMRDALAERGGDPAKVNPFQPSELVIDHSIQVDVFGTPKAYLLNAERELERNRERYAFLRWGQEAFRNLRVVPPNTGIVHQVNLEYLARGVMVEEDEEGRAVAFPDTLVGTDSHTTMINGLGVLGWGVGGIEAEAAMLGEAISMPLPEVVGFRLDGRLREGATATDLVLTVTERLRRHGVVGRFVEFYGPGLEALTLADRATIANMAPEYGATCGMFPVDEVTLEYLRFTGRPDEQVALVEAYFREQGLFHAAGAREATFSDRLELDLGEVEPSLAGPRRPQDRVPLGRVKESFLEQLDDLAGGGGGRAANAERAVGRWEGEGGDAQSAGVATAETRTAADTLTIDGEEATVGHGSVVIAAITSCTNTSNPSVMLAAGLLAKKAVERGLSVPPWVKTSLAPGSKVVTDYLAEAGLTEHLEALRFHLVGYGCTTCIGNSGPLPEPVSKAIADGGLVAVSVLSGNRNFEGRINPEVRANYLASPPLVVAYALAGRIDVDLESEPLGTGKDGEPVLLRDLWPSQEEIQETMARAVQAEMFRRQYADVFRGDEHWRDLEVPEGETYAWDEGSTYVRRPPYFEELPDEPEVPEDIEGARALVVVGDSVTTDHISPAGAFGPDSPAGRYLIEKGVEPRDFNSYGARRGNHEVMMRGTFANVRLRNLLVPGIEGGVTVHLPDGERMSVFEAAMRYREEGVPLVVLAGKEYGTGSSRDWAAKGPRLLGVRAVLAGSFERIHRSNLVGMGVLPLELPEGESAESLGLTGRERFDLRGVAAAVEAEDAQDRQVEVTAEPDEGDAIRFRARLRLDTPQERLYIRHGGILPYVLRRLAGLAD